MECDLLVVGSGAGGLAAAVTAAHLGLDVIVAEKAAQFGGTTAWSGGWMWVPRNPLAQEVGIIEDEEAPRTYLRHILGARYEPARVDRLLAMGPRMVRFFRTHTALDFIDGNAIPDFHAEAPGGATGGRSLCAAPFDGRALGARIRDLRPPLRETAPFGMGIASGEDLRRFMTMTRSFASFRHVVGRVLRHARDLLLHGRGMHLVNGNALVARLLKSADDEQVRLLAASPVARLVVRDGVVTGAVLRRGGQDVAVHARRGVVLAAGGFPHDVARIARSFAHAPTGREHFSAAPKTNAGDGLRLGEQAGGVVRTDLAAAGAWAPVSLAPRRGAEPGHFPHLIERAKPGLIAVRRNGARFANEADSYHDVMAALFAATPPGEPAEAWLIADHAFIRRYGLGAARPAPVPLWPFLRSGYVRRARSLAGLATLCGIDPAGLAASIAAYNPPAREGHDPAFHRGESAYNRIQGDRDHAPNPCVAPIETAPFYAVQIRPGSLGTFAGLSTDADARVINDEAQPIAGLYAVGNDMSSVMGGTYPAGGITLGPAMTFGYVAAHHAAGVPLDNNRN
ncbi:MAG: FAD-dependent oxidoreductase [Rhodospirillales bacterium]|nr:FAD-dependent oxidoreductase [Rhodospirillales bacterium]MDE2575758.1 FAD-dependent oxidoreductase [Rhodospirillales bacterium]